MEQGSGPSAVASRVSPGGGSIVVAEQRTRPSPYDPDLDPSPRPSAGAGEMFEVYQRFIANPFLAVLACIPVLLLIRAGLQSHQLAWFLGGLCLLCLTFLLVQFHCLDCGATGWLWRSRRHACPELMNRWRAGKLGRLRPPPLSTQILVWLYVMAAVGALVIVRFALRA
jgi:hypothetical protein